MTERYAMHGFHFTHMVSRPARVSWPRRMAISIGLVVLSLVVVGMAWVVGRPWRGDSE